MTATFTDEEYHRLIALVSNDISKTQPRVFSLGTYSYFKSSNDSWIMDSGAIDHISKTFPTPNGKHPKHTFVELPNGGKIRIDSVGTMKLSDDLIIKYVFYVPEFKVNLLSINKL